MNINDAFDDTDVTYAGHNLSTIFIVFVWPNLITVFSLVWFDKSQSGTLVATNTSSIFNTVFSSNETWQGTK